MSEPCAEDLPHIDAESVRLARALIAELERAGYLTPGAPRAVPDPVEDGELARRLTYAEASAALAERGYRGWSIWKIGDAARRGLIRAERGGRPHTLLLGELLEDIQDYPRRKQALEVRRKVNRSGRRGRPRKGGGAR